MKNLVLLTVVVALGFALLSGCASIQTGPDYGRSAESKMVVIQENIGDGLKAGALSPDQSRMFLTTLKGIRTDYVGLRNKRVSSEEWTSLHGRLDVLEEKIDRALTRTTRIEGPRSGDRIVKLQQIIDVGKSSERLSQAEATELQDRLDNTRSDYLRMTEGGRSASYEERIDIFHRLDSLEADLNRYR